MNAYNSITPETIQKDMRYLQLLSHSFPTIADASTEIINLEAILNLPKGTEHFLADLHGEYEAFQHVLRNASGGVGIFMSIPFELPGLPPASKRRHKNAQAIAAHESPKTTKLYDRTSDEITLDEVERIAI